MKIKSVVFYLVLFLIPINTFAVYDVLSINITPTNNDIQFCFHTDYATNAHTYLAAQMNNEFYFLSQNKEMSQWLPGNEPPIFAEKASFMDKPICFDPLPKSVMQSISVYAGVGTSLNEVQANNRYARIFSGFAELPQPTKKWTVMVYMVGSDLEKRGKWASKDIAEMLAGTSQLNSDAVSMVISTGGSNRYGWDTIKRAFISNGQKYTIDDVGAKSMAKPQNLTEFVVWAKANFPAEHYALVLWNHGSATKGFGLDTSKAGAQKLMSLPELHQAYKDIRSQIDKPFDVVIYDACLMASIEVAEITATLAEAMGGSAELEPGHGIDYAHLLSNASESLPANGIAFGNVVKTGYIQQTKDKGTFNTSQITYSVFDLTKLSSFTATFAKFAEEFNTLLQDTSFFNYERLSHGIIRAPGYPFKKGGRPLGSLRTANTNHVHIDLYNILQTIGPEFPEFKNYADELLAILDQMIVYDVNDRVKNVHPDAGRVSIDIGGDKSYLDTLPAAYTLLDEAFDYYNRRKLEDSFTPTGEKIQFSCVVGGGVICAAFENWLKLSADDVLGVESYSGQKTGDVSEIYLIESLYQYTGNEITEKLEFGTDGQQACQYQICAADSSCENATLTKQGDQLLADISLNEFPAILSFCQTANEEWTACGVVQQMDGVWGRNDILYHGDTVIPNTLHLQGDEVEQHSGNALLVDSSVPVTLKKNCDASKAVILAAAYSLNGTRQFENLCQASNCVCEAKDFEEGKDDEGNEKGDDACKTVGTKAGVFIEP